MPPKGADEGAVIEPFRLLQEGFALRGEVLSQRWESTQRIAGGRLRMSAPRSYSPFPRSPFMGGVLLIGESGITGAQSIGVLGCDSFRATGPWVCKICF